MVERLVKDDPLDFTDLETYVDCIKSKTTNTYRKHATKYQDTLDLIHTDVCGPFSPCFIGQKYFITFINDYSRYMYLYIIYKKSEIPQAFENFKLKVEKQSGKPIMVV